MTSLLSALDATTTADFYDYADLRIMPTSASAVIV